MEELEGVVLSSLHTLARNGKVCYFKGQYCPQRRVHFNLHLPTFEPGSSDHIRGQDHACNLRVAIVVEWPKLVVASGVISDRLVYPYSKVVYQFYSFSVFQVHFIILHLLKPKDMQMMD